MSLRRPSHAPINHERWLVSYADFVTLLFAFFVVLYASAQMDSRRGGGLSAAIDSAFHQLGIFQSDGKQVPGGKHKPLAGSRTPTDTSAAQKTETTAIKGELQTALSQEIQRNEVALFADPQGLVLSLREAGFFDSGSATIRAQAQDALARTAEVLQRHPYALRVEGHTDTVPIHNQQFASNWELSTARATELIKILIQRYGVAAERLSAAGYAEFHPVASNFTTQGRALNRRVDIVVLIPSTGKPAAVDPVTAGATGDGANLPRASQREAVPRAASSIDPG